MLNKMNKEVIDADELSELQYKADLHDRLLEALKYAQAEIQTFYDMAASGEIDAEISIGQFGRLDSMRKVIADAAQS